MLLFPCSCWLDYADSNLYKSFLYPCSAVLIALTWIKGSLYFEKWKAEGVEDKDTKKMKALGTMVQKKLWKSKHKP